MLWFFSVYYVINSGVQPLSCTWEQNVVEWIGRMNFVLVQPAPYMPLLNLHVMMANYINSGYGLSLVDTLWNASSYRQPLEQEGNPMT